MREPDGGTGAGIVLIHGAWAAGWVWDKVVPLLAARGFEPVVVDLPGSDGIDFSEATQQGYREHVCGIVRALKTPVWLISHSGGGAVAAEVAETMPDCVLGIVFIAGMMLPSGVSFGDLFALSPTPLGQDTILAHLVANKAGTATRVPAEVARQVFFHRACPGDSRAAAERLGWQSNAGKDLRPVLTDARYGRVPRLYVEATDDRSVALAAQRYMQQLSPGAQVVSCEADHAPLLSAPEALVDAILPFLEQHSHA